MKFAGVCVIGLLALATAANGQVMVDVQDMGSVGVGLTAYKVSFSGLEVGAIDVGFNGPMNQEWIPFMATHLETPTMDNAGLLVDETVDSHILLETADMISVLYPALEDNPTPPVGTGSYLANPNDPVAGRMVFGIVETSRSDPLEFAWIVVPDGQSVQMTGFAGVSGVDYPVSANIPEPATLCLLALGGLALMRRRNK